MEFGAQPFDRQLERGSSSLQQAAAHPLPSMGKEQQLHLQLQEQEERQDALQAAFNVTHRGLEAERTEHAETKAALQRLVGACRRLGTLKAVQEEAVRGDAGESADPAQEGGPGASSHLLSTKPRDIRVHGGYGQLNKFAFGSDQLQELIAQHDKHNGEAGHTHGRRSSLDAASGSARESEREERSQQAQDRFRRMSSMRSAKARDAGQFDIFGNAVVARQASNNNNARGQAQADGQGGGVFASEDTGRSVHERGSSDLQADAHLANAGMWRNQATAQ